MDIDKLKVDIKTDNSKIRTTMKKLSIRGDFEFRYEKKISFIKKTNGKVYVKWAAHVPVKSVERVKCDLGHFHEVEKTEHWVWNYCELSKQDVEKMLEFLA
jgi:hypothetical protein